jgi:hypothetical protein
VSDTADDPLDDVVSYLYSLAVSEGGLQEALGANADVGAVEAALKRAVGLEFDRINILAGPGEELPLVKYPVREQVSIEGKGATHTPSFVQRNGALVIMETVDFTAKEKERAKDHAGLAAYIFDDISRVPGLAVSTIALVRATSSDLVVPSVAYGMAMLTAESSQIVNWLDPKARTTFLEERRRIAIQ